MKAVKVIFSICVALVVMAVLGVALWSMGNWFVHMDPRIAGPTFAALITIVGVIYAQWHLKTRDIAQSHRPEKIKVYEHLFGIMEMFLKNPEELKQAEEEKISDEMRDAFWELNKGLVVWASPSVLQAWLKFRRVSTNQTNERNRNLFVMDELLNAIRKDLGNSNLQLQPGDTVRMFLKDPDELGRDTESE